jgi:murein DD-endopeptidase MepM/ murein hydrolase activator NlpD
MVSDSLKFALENGIPVQRNAGQIIADAQKYAQGKGVTLAQAIQDTFTVPLTNKPEYKNAIQSIQLEKSPMFKFGLQKELKALDLANEKEMAQYRASLDPELAEKWEAVRQRATENISLGELLGDELGTYKKNRGVDLAGKMGDAIVAPPGAKVVEVRQANGDGTVSLARVGEGAMSAKDVGYGNSVLLQLPDGKYMRYSHLQDINVNLGDNLSGGVVVGTRGNTGNVRGKNGEKLTAEQLAAGRGAHVDVEI